MLLSLKITITENSCFTKLDHHTTLHDLHWITFFSLFICMTTALCYKGRISELRNMILIHPTTAWNFHECQNLSWVYTYIDRIVIDWSISWHGNLFINMSAILHVEFVCELWVLKIGPEDRCLHSSFMGSLVPLPYQVFMVMTIILLQICLSAAFVMWTSSELTHLTSHLIKQVFMPQSSITMLAECVTCVRNQCDQVCCICYYYILIFLNA
jgi:hypothetical protein